MATRKTAASSKKTTATRKKAAPVAKKTTTKVTTVAASASGAARSTTSVLPTNLVNILLAELVGTFVLTSVALMTSSDVVPLYVGLTLAVLVMAVGGVSGAHVNPAVTFGLWASRKLKSALLPFYWIAQLIGAMAAVLVGSAVSGTKIALDFGHFGTFAWPIFFAELIGTAIFIFGLVSVVNRAELTVNMKAFGIGLALFVGLLVGGTFYTQSRTAAIDKYQTAAQKDSGAEISHEIYVKGVTLNPAIALASTESTKSELTSGSAAGSEKHYSRLGWETILSTLIGAALGGNLALLVAYRFRS